MDVVLDNPFTPIIAACIGVGLLLGLVARFVKSAIVASLVAPIIFLAGYYLTYQQIPDFPPAGSTNKIFYIAVFAAIFGIIVDLFEQRWQGRTRSFLFAIASLLVALAAAFWIAQPRFTEPDSDFILAFVALSLGGAIILRLLQRAADGDAPSHGPFVATALLAVLPAAFAPLALFGASSTSVGLCLGLAAGMAILAIIAIFAPRRLGATAIFGAGGGLLAVLFTVAFISKRIDYLLLPLLLAVPFLGLIGARLAALSGRPTLWRVGLSIAVLAVALIALISGSLFLRHDNPLGT